MTRSFPVQFCCAWVADFAGLLPDSARLSPLSSLSATGVSGLIIRRSSFGVLPRIEALKTASHDSSRLLFDYSAVALTDFSPTAVQPVLALTEGRFGGGFFVDLNSPSRLLAHPQVSILHLGAAVKDFPVCVH